jgi:hypothetical protein
MMSVKGLREELVGLQFEWIKELERDVVEGSNLTVTAVVVQVVGRKV